MFKIFVIIIIAVGIFFWYPTSGDPIKKEILSPTTQHSVPVSYTHLRAHETRHDLVCRLLLEKKKKKNTQKKKNKKN